MRMHATIEHRGSHGLQTYHPAYKTAHPAQHFDRRTSQAVPAASVCCERAPFERQQVQLLAKQDLNSVTEHCLDSCT